MNFPSQLIINKYCQKGFVFMKKLLPKSKNCFCCGNENVKGLNIDYYFEESKVTAEFLPNRDYIITESILHPGVAAGILFEAMVWVPAYILKQAMILLDFNIRVSNPIIIEKKMNVLAEAISINKWLSEVQGVIKDEEGKICFKAVGKFTFANVDDEHVNTLSQNE